MGAQLQVEGIVRSEAAHGQLCWPYEEGGCVPSRQGWKLSAFLALVINFYIDFYYFICASLRLVVI